MKWISVKEKLPKEEQQVICYIKINDSNLFVLIHCIYIDSNFSVKYPFYQDYYINIENNMIPYLCSNIYEDNFLYFHGEIIYWMLLPELPQK